MPLLQPKASIVHERYCLKLQVLTAADLAIYYLLYYYLLLTTLLLTPYYPTTYSLLPYYLLLQKETYAPSSIQRNRDKV